MKRIVFTFGTLYDDNVIKKLLGDVPVNFYATLPGYTVYKGIFSQIPQKVQDRLKHVNKDTFTFLFAKTDLKESYIYGRAYEINLAQEIMLDHWEIYPDWYRKKSVTIRSHDECEHEAFIYTLDYDGEKLTEYNRVINDPAEVITNAQAARKRMVEKFPETFL